MPADDRQLIHRYLLGDLQPDDERRLNEAILTDGAFFEEVQQHEFELIDEYVRGRTPAAERQAVERFLDDPDRQRQSNLMESLADRFRAETATATPGEGANVAPSAETATLTLPSSIALAAAASLLLSCVSAAYFALELSRIQSDLAATGRAAGTPSTQARPVPSVGARSPMRPSMPSPRPAPTLAPLSFSLRPYSATRSRGEAALVLEIPPSADRVALYLELPANPTSSAYTFTLRRAGGPQIWGEADVRLRDPSAQSLVVEIPTPILTTGDYLLEVTGVGARSGGEYRFRIATR